MISPRDSAIVFLDLAPIFYLFARKHPAHSSVVSSAGAFDIDDHWVTGAHLGLCELAGV